MTILTTQQKIDAYQYVLDLLNTGYESCVCPLLKDYLRSILPIEERIIISHRHGLVDMVWILDYFPEFLEMKPPQRVIDDLWWDIGSTERISAVEECIYNLKNQHQ